jgi:hypothetical protein
MQVGRPYPEWLRISAFIAAKKDLDRAAKQVVDHPNITAAEPVREGS